MRQIVDDAFGPVGKGLSLQSLRHYVQNTLEECPGITEKVIRDIVDHEGKDVHQRNYSKRAQTTTLMNAINQLPIVF